MAATAFLPSVRNTNIYNMNSSAGPSPPENAYSGQRGYASPTLTPPSSETSPSQKAFPQLRQPRQPMYIPAALRPTDQPTGPKTIPSRPRAPDTPPGSNENSLDSGKSTTSLPSARTANLTRPRTSSSRDSVPHIRRDSTLPPSPQELEYNTASVTGPPTTAHWKPDGLYASCHVCLTNFSWYFRRHHCRRCGEVVCDADSRSAVPLDQNARYHSDGVPSRACDPCAAGWREVARLNLSRANSLVEEGGKGAEALAIPGQAKPNQELLAGSMAKSEGGMHWSTF